MAARTRYFNAYDIDRIRGFLELATVGGSERYRYLVGLKQELENAVILPPEEMPPDVVTMNSQVRINDITNGGSIMVRLVFPQDADYEQKKSRCWRRSGRHCSVTMRAKSSVITPRAAAQES